MGRFGIVVAALSVVLNIEAAYAQSGNDQDNRDDDTQNAGHQTVPSAVDKGLKSVVHVLIDESTSSAPDPDLDAGPKDIGSSVSKSSALIADNAADAAVVAAVAKSAPRAGARPGGSHAVRSSFRGVSRAVSTAISTLFSGFVMLILGAIGTALGEKD